MSDVSLPSEGPSKVPSEASPNPSKAGRREWLGLAVIALPCMLYSMDLTVLDLALPALGRALKPTSEELLWVVDIYGFLLAGFLITMGILGDRIGRRRLLLIGAAGFGAASVLCAFSTSATMLIVARGVQGIAGATLAPSTLSLIRNLFSDAKERTFAIGIWATSFSTGAAIGPVAGGFLLERFWWGSAFLIGAPVMALLLLVGPFLLPEFRAEHRSSLDWLSPFLSAFSVLPIIYGIKRAALGGSTWIATGSVLIGIAAGVLFLRRQRQLREPLLDLGLFRIPEFTTSLVVNLCALFATFGSFLFFALCLQQVHGLPQFTAGLCMLPAASGFIIGSQLAPQLVKRFPTAHVICGSLLVAAAGLGVFAQLGPESSLAALIGGSVLMALGSSPAVTLVTDLVVSSAPAERAGAASALSETCGELGGALGIAILGTIASALYRVRMAELGEVARTGVETLSGALASAESLPHESAVLLIAQARAAFLDGVRVAMLIAALVTVASAVLVYVRLGRRGLQRAPSKSSLEQCQGA
ncbi:MAG TPA: MFS transporter [Polyangiaceae bacterium]|nr:MFS transporter [Polyangiaceae bacterium]